MSKQLIVAFVSMSALAHVCLAGLSDNEKQELVAEHNKYRRMVANGKAVDQNGKALAPAADMTELVWDDNLAAATQSYLDQCVLDTDGTVAHDKNHGKDVGENIAAGSPTESVQNAVKGWYDEIVKPGLGECDLQNWEDAKCKQAGHFSQAIWSTSWKLGCGRKKCNQWDTIICRYSPAGNMDPGYQTYTKGAAASKCASTQTAANGLCKGQPGPVKMGTACLDHWSNCGELASACNQEHIKKGCCKTCGSTSGTTGGTTATESGSEPTGCQDTYNNCATDLVKWCWQEDTKRDCCKTCSSGEGLAVSKCYDEFSNCADLKAACEDTEWNPHVAKQCKKTCGKC